MGGSMFTGNHLVKQLIAPLLALGMILLPLPHVASAASPNVSLNFDAMSFADSGMSSPTNPDTHVAVGPAHIVEVINETIAIFSKATGAKLFQQDLITFFGAALTKGPGGFDPGVTYDELAG